MNPLSDLKKRLDQLTEWDRTQGVRIPAAPVFVKAIEDAIRLAEIYRDIAAKEGHVCHGIECQPVCRMARSIDEEAASRLFKGEKNENSNY